MSSHDNPLLHDSVRNVDQLETARDLWASVVAEVLCRGWYGEASVHLVIADGTIQRVESRTVRCDRPIAH
jgi:hypothetical protein